MKKNMGTADRVIRSLLAIGVGILYFTNTISGTLAIIFGIFAIVFLVSSFFGTCPMYLLFGISTCRRKKASVVSKGECQA